ncbi:MAG TPA: HlyD family secretion protein [Thermoanaerobaculia bacterium]|nr:HlyD family secretion protein [Thermoanaerobaculia bacterium]
MDLNDKKPVIAPNRAKRLYTVLGALVVVILIAWGAFALATSGKETTDDAQIAADIVPVASRVPGQITAVHVTENQPVTRGTLIAEIDPRDLEVKVAQAEGELETAKAQAQESEAKLHIARATATGGFTAAQAAVESSRESASAQSGTVSEARAGVQRAEANAQKAAADWTRAKELGEKGDISRAQVDTARAANEAAQAEVAAARARLQSATNAQQLAEANIKQAQGRLAQSAPVEAQVGAAEATANLSRAKVRTAQAALDAARLALSYTKITAPADGIASKLAVHPGSLVAAGQPLVQLVPRQTYIVANFKETQVRSMHPGQRVHIKIDALGGDDFEGKVESLSGGTGASFSLLPPDNASGNFVKVVQRIPVRISWNGPTADRVPAGSSAEVTVYTK